MAKQAIKTKGDMVLQPPKEPWGPRRPEDQGGKRGPGGHGDQGILEKAMMTVVPILKTKEAKNNVEVNKIKEVKKIGFEHQETRSPRMPSRKEPGQGTTEIKDQEG